MSGFRISRVRRRSVTFRPASLFCSGLILTALLSGLAKPLVAQIATRNSAAPQGPAASGGLDPSSPGQTPQTRGPAEDVEIEGELTVVVEDRPEGSRQLYFLEAGGVRYSLRGVATGDGLLTGMRVRIKGSRNGAEIALEPGTAGLVLVSESGAGTRSVQPDALPNTFGAQRTVVLLVNFANNTSQPFTVPGVRSIVFTGATSASNFDLENSYGQTWLTGDVFGWYTVSFNLAASACTFTDLTTVASQAQALAVAAGVNFTGYTRFVYALADTASCGFWGLGTVGGNPSSAWINGDPQLQVVAHEMGHNFGLSHSHALDCHPAIIGTGCPTLEYGDEFDIMGNSSYHFNAYQKERLGWLAFGSSPPMTTVGSNGTYTIDTYETVGSNPKALKIPIGATGTNYYVEMRKAIGFDAGMAGNTNVLNGVVIHQASLTDGNSSDLLDMTPADTSFLNAALDVGLSFTDAPHNITITAVSVGASNATVSVNLGGATCTRANPTVTLSPPVGAGVAAGTTVPFTFSVTNRDSGSCTAATFDLTDVVPAGWTGSFTATSLALSPGATGSTTLQVTSAASAANGSYPFTATAKNHAATSYTATASATYVVSNPVCTLANPTVSLSPPVGAGVAAGTTVPFTFSVTSHDSASCAAATFDLTDVVPAGWTGSFTATSLTLSPGATGSTTLQVTSAASAANGSYPFTATASNRAATSYTATASATYVVSNPVCTLANPTVTLSPPQGAPVPAGTPVSYTMSVTSNNSGACPAATFDLTDTVPLGWNAVLGTSSLSIASGATASTTLLVTSSVTAVDGSYTVTATAKNRAATSFTATASAIYVVANPGGTVGTFTDNFNRADSTDLGSSWTEVTGNLVVAGGMLKNGLGVTGNSMAVQSTLSGPTETVDADFTSVDNNLGPRFGIVLRYQNATNYYLIYRQTGGSSRLLISRFVNGVETILAAAGIVNPAKLVPFHIRARASGTSLSLDFNGVNKVNATDASFAAGKVGVLIGNNASTAQQQADNFTATVQ
jgi:hypothetical protein